MAFIETMVKAIDRVLNRSLEIFIVTNAALLVVLMNYAVFMRYVMDSSVGWGEELPGHLLALLTFMGAAWLTRLNEHLSFDSVVRMMPPLPKKIVQIFNLLIVAAFSSLLAWYGGSNALGYLGRTLFSVDIPIWVFRGGLPVGCGLIALICVVRLIALIVGRITPEDVMAHTEEDELMDILKKEGAISNGN